MFYKYQLRTWKLTRKDGWKSSFDDFDTLEELTKHIEHLEKNAPVGVPECIARTYEIKRVYIDDEGR